MAKYTYAMSGDLGDVIYSLRTCHYLNDPSSIYYLVDRPFTKAWSKSRFEALVPLIEEQPYIGEVVMGEYPSEPTHNFTDFRKFIPYCVPLSEIRANWVKVKLPEYTPWLFCKPSRELEGKVIVHRSSRYNNPLFPWRQISEAFGDRIVAVGLSDEYDIIKKALGRDVPLRETKSYYDLAQLIAGCGLFIGNQSSPCSIAIGLGVPLVQETNIKHPDCLYPGHPNSWYGYSSDVIIDGVRYGSPSTTLIEPDVLPPGKWRFEINGKKYMHASLGMMQRQVMRENGLNSTEARDQIMVQNTIRVRRDYPKYNRKKEDSVIDVVGATNVGVKTKLQ